MKCEWKFDVNESIRETLGGLDALAHPTHITLTSAGYPRQFSLCVKPLYC